MHTLNNKKNKNQTIKQDQHTFNRKNKYIPQDHSIK